MVLTASVECEKYGNNCTIWADTRWQWTGGINCVSYVSARCDMVEIL